MGNKPNNLQKGNTTVGHSVGAEAYASTAGKSKSFRTKVLNAFSVQTIGKALQFNRKKDGKDGAMQSYQPNDAPTPGAGGGPASAATQPSFSPLDFKEIQVSYEVDWSKAGVLGQGHYATVYRGKNILNLNAVAVKKVSKKLTRVDSLRAEVEALRKVSGHPNIVELYDVYLDENFMYLMLELLAGGELFDRIVQSGAYSERDAASHMKKIGSALQYMHSRGIVHRDLKPENLVLADSSPDSDIKISDFGLSKILKDDEEVMMTICGTKAYSAPEVGFGFRQAGIPRNDTGYSSKVDMWSLGVILFVIISAYHPFDPQGVDRDDVIWGRIVAGRWDFNDKTWDGMSETLKDVIKKLIETDPEKRLSAEQFLQHPWLNDAQTPVRPLPSLSRQRSSRYWHIQQVGGVTPVPKAPAPITEGADEAAGDAQQARDNGSEQAPKVEEDASAQAVTSDNSSSKEDQNLV